MSMKTKPFVIEKNVLPAAIDHLGHVNNVVYLEWVQEVSQAHWNTCASESIKQNYYWVALQHSITYKKPAFEGDVLELKTWIESLDGVKSERRVLITRLSDRALIAKSETIWCLIDAKTQRPKRIPQEIKALYE